MQKLYLKILFLLQLLWKTVTYHVHEPSYTLTLKNLNQLAQLILGCNSGYKFYVG